MAQAEGIGRRDSEAVERRIEVRAWTMKAAIRPGGIRGCCLGNAGSRGIWDVGTLRAGADGAMCAARGYVCLAVFGCGDGQ